MIKRISFHVKKLYFKLSNLTQRFFNPKIEILTKFASLKKLLLNQVSISRYGDGEIRLINGESIEFQEHTPLLEQRLKEVLVSEMDNHAVCISGVFGSLKQYTKAESYFWHKHLSAYRKVWMKYLNPKRVYLNTFITRPYMGYKDKSQCGEYFNEFKKVWEGRDLLIVEGEKTRFGISNNLLANAKSIKRILCPSENAFNYYEEILTATIDYFKSTHDQPLVLIALGPTATVLAYDLAKNGKQAIDIGHLDIEYEWFLMGATRKVEITGKYTNEAVYDKSTIKDCPDTSYHKEIIMTII